MIQIMPIFIIDLKDPFFKVEHVTENVSSILFSNLTLKLF